MANGIRERLLEQAAKFHRWQETIYPGKTAQELGGEWEIDYPAWEDVWDAICHVLTDFKVGQAEERVPMQPGSQRPDPGFCKGLP